MEASHWQFVTSYYKIEFHIDSIFAGCRIKKWERLTAIRKAPNQVGPAIRLMAGDTLQ